MSDREALEVALGPFWVGFLYRMEKEHWSTDARAAMDVIYAAARERLAQMPEHCGNCYPTEGAWGDGIEHDHDGTPLGVCHLCHGSGKVYPAETVEKIAKIIAEIGQLDEKAIMILDALGETE